MLALIGAGIGLALVLSQRSDTNLGPNPNESLEEIEDFVNGRSRDRNLFPGKTLVAENSRIVRPVTNGVQHPEVSAKIWSDYHRKYENIAHSLYAHNAAGGQNMRIFRNDINKRVRQPTLPDKESYSEWAVIPNAHFEYDQSSTVYPDMDYSFYEDQAGDAIAVPGAPHYIFTSQEYLGNPWGPSGQTFNTEGLRTKSKKDLQRDKIPDVLKKKNKVAFYGLPQ